jgi:DNA polymerase III epsilon subunit-like protein
MESPAKEIYISVDVETAGPNPSQYSLLSIGACLVFEPTQTFYVELQPVNAAFTTDCLEITGLDMDTLKAHGLPPRAALEQFADWVNRNTPAGAKPIFVAFNAPFDWMFVTDYFHRHLGDNPFGHKALDIKAFYMGKNNTQWSDTGFDAITKHYQIEQSLNHNALQDAIAQARLFRRMLEEQGNPSKP